MFPHKIIHTDLEGNFSENYIKEYNKEGQLIHFKGFYKEVFYIYDGNKIIEKKTRKFNQYGVADDVVRATYEYYNLGYRITHLRTKFIDDSYTTKSLGNLVTPEEYAATYEREVNDLLRIEEVVMENENIQSVKIVNVESGLNTFEEYRYKNDLVVRKDFYHLLGEQQDLLKSISYEYNDKGQIVEKTVVVTDDEYPCVYSYSYEESKVICVMENKFSPTESIKEITITEYDDKKRIIRLREPHMEYDYQYLYLSSYSDEAQDELLDICIKGFCVDNSFNVISKTDYHYD